MKHEPKNIDVILARHFSRQSTTEEDQIVERWLNNSEANQRAYQKLKTYIHQPQINITDNRLKIWNQLKKDNQFNKNKKYWAFAGKVAAILLFISSIIFINNQIDSEDIQEEITVQIIDKVAGPGQKLLVTLPDNSLVKLNSESKISYPSSFSDSIRIVTLVGEAFFDIQKDSLKPFLIHTKNITTQVIGTSFNINAYPEEKDVQVALLTGKVKVQDYDNNEYYLNPGQLINISDNDYEIELFNYQKSFGWKEGIIRFDNASFQEVIQKLERWYGVKFTYNQNQSIPEWNYQGVFANATLKEVLQVLADSEGFNFEINSDIVTINL